MTNFKLIINLDNAAFEYTEIELARILKNLSIKIEMDLSYSNGSILDTNGNKVGSWAITQ